MQAQTSDLAPTATQKRFHAYATATIRTVAAGRTTSVPAADVHAACKAWMLAGRPMSTLIHLIAVLPGIEMKTPPKAGASPVRDYQWPHVEKEWATLAATVDAWDPELAAQIIENVERLVPEQATRRHAALLEAAAQLPDAVVGPVATDAPSTDEAAADDTAAAADVATDDVTTDDVATDEFVADEALTDEALTDEFDVDASAAVTTAN